MWHTCNKCGLFRDCEDVIPPQKFWNNLKGERLLTERRWICMDCKRTFPNTADGYYEMQEFVFNGFQP